MKHFHPARELGQSSTVPAAGTQKPWGGGTGCPHTQHSTLGAAMCLLLPSLHPGRAGDQPQHPRISIPANPSLLGALAGCSLTWLSCLQSRAGFSECWTEGKGWNNKCAAATTPITQGSHDTAAELEPNTKYPPPLLCFSHTQGVLGLEINQEH